jgi:transposase-like protein
MPSQLSAPHFHDEDAAFAYVESFVWPNGPVCVHCGETERVSKMGGKATRRGLHKCYACRKQFTVRMGTIFESSHVPLRVWLQAMFLVAGSKKGISANQLSRTLGVSIKTGWFLGHRIREAMRSSDLSPFGGIVEVDETYIGFKEGAGRPKGGWHHKMKVLSLVQRGGPSRSMVFENTNAACILPLVFQNVAAEAHVMTDDSRIYCRSLAPHFSQHSIINHTFGEYVKGDVHTNTVEGFFSVFKRGMRGVYQHCKEKHLHRYLAEFDFRYSNRIALGCTDQERANRLLRGIVGRRLTYQTASARA